METIIKKGHYKILKLFYQNKNKKIHLREIARRVNLNENAVSKILKSLELQLILKSEKQANLKIFSLQKNMITNHYLSFFDIQKFNKLPILRKKAIKLFLEKLNEKPIIVVLFGSTAKENFTKKSDLDLLLITNKKINTKIEESYVEAQTGININCLQITYDFFLKEIKTKDDILIQSILKTGYPILNHQMFYEAVEK